MLDLPTDAQWEYACRAGTGTPINTGKASPNANDWNAVAWYNAPDAIAGKCKWHYPVGTKLQNGWGLYDMHGNILELCLDWCVTNATDFVATFQEGWQNGAVTTNPVGVAYSAAQQDVLRVVKRGGSSSNDATHLPSGFHMVGGWNYKDGYIGFRLVCPLSDVVGLLGDPNATPGDDVAQ